MRRRGLLEHLVADKMAVGVVDLLEMVEIEHRHGHAGVILIMRPFALQSGEFLTGPCQYMATVVESREWVCRGVTLQGILSIPELPGNLAQEYKGDAVHDQRYHGDNDEGDGDDLPDLTSVVRYIHVHLEAPDDLAGVVIDGHVGLNDIHIELALVCQVLHAVLADELCVIPAAQGVAEPSVAEIAFPYDLAVRAVNDALVPRVHLDLDDVEGLKELSDTAVELLKPLGRYLRNDPALAFGYGGEEAVPLDRRQCVTDIHGAVLGKADEVMRNDAPNSESRKSQDHGGRNGCYVGELPQKGVRRLEGLRASLSWRSVYQGACPPLSAI